MGRGWALLSERAGRGHCQPGLFEEPEGGRPPVRVPPSVHPHPPGTVPPPPQPHLEAQLPAVDLYRFPGGLILVLVYISAGAVVAPVRTPGRAGKVCVWALPMGHGEPPCPLASWAGDVRPRVALTPPGVGSPGDSAWLLTWPWPAVLSGNLVLPRAAHTWRTSTAFALLAAPPVSTSLPHPDCQDDQPKRCSGLQKRPPPGVRGVRGAGPSPLQSPD